MKIVALTGLPRSGKDTFADRLVSAHGFVRRAFADPLKDAAAILLGRPRADMNGENGFDREAVLPEWGFTTRDFLQRFGTEVMRDNFGQDFWLRHMRSRIAAYQIVACNTVITDLRFENEAELVRELGGIVVQICRPGCIRSGHVSDAGVTADRYVYNDSTIEHLNFEADYIARVTSRPAAQSA
jgi:hypothetical protein